MKTHTPEITFSYFERVAIEKAKAIDAINFRIGMPLEEDTAPLGELSRYVKTIYQIKVNNYGELIIRRHKHEKKFHLLEERDRHDIHVEIYNKFGNISRKVVENMLNDILIFQTKKLLLNN